MSLLRFALIAALSLAACTSADVPDYDAELDDGAGGKADDASSIDLEWCKEAAGEYARALYNDFEDFEILDTTVATVLETHRKYLLVQTDSTGHDHESTDIIVMARECYPIGSVYGIEDLGAAVYFARRAAAAVQQHVEETWDFDRILASEVRWPVTSRGATVDVRVLDLGFDEGSFAVTLGSSGKVLEIEQTGSFTP